MNPFFKSLNLLKIEAMQRLQCLKFDYNLGIIVFLLISTSILMLITMSGLLHELVKLLNIEQELYPEILSKIDDKDILYQHVGFII